MSLHSPRMRVYHAHVYFDARTREAARRIRDRLVSEFAADCRWRDRPIGPHTRPNFRVKFSREQFGPLVRWLMLHREGLSVLIHPYTEDHVADHSDRALWLGKSVRLKFDFLRNRTRR